MKQINNCGVAPGMDFLQTGSAYGTALLPRRGYLFVASGSTAGERLDELQAAPAVTFIRKL